MWYLKDGDISQNKGDIKLTDEQAQLVIEAKQLGKIVSYENNELIFAKPLVESVEPEIYEPTIAELQAQNEAQKAYLISAATQEIAILQDAIDLNIAEDGDTELLTEYKRYRVLLSRVDTSLTEIEWPTKPE